MDVPEKNGQMAESPALLPPSTCQVILRPPGIDAETRHHFVAPTTDWLAGTWNVTQSSLPLWKSCRNVRITYTVLDASNKDGVKHMDDLVEYQPLDSAKLKTVGGIDKASGPHAGGWDWRGKGWLMIASSHWEILGWGQEESIENGYHADQQAVEDRDLEQNQWMVTYFLKTPLTPAGIDIYSRKKAGLSATTLEAIKML